MEVRIATTDDLYEGQLIASRLRAEGIPYRIRSESLGPIVMNVGAMATTELFVPEEFADLARRLLSDEGA